MTEYVALLRGINVGGRNVIRMAELRACLEEHDYREVATYIQSGNVLFRSGSGPAGLTKELEAVLARTFDYRASVVLRTLEQMRAIVGEAPEGFGTAPKKYRYDVIFLKEPLEAAVAIESVETREGVDDVHAGSNVLYFSRLISRAAQSRLSRLAANPVYQSMTVRNWNTTTKLLSMMESRER